MTLAQSERAALSDLFDEVDPQAPTLCEGWTAHDLAAHLWIRESDPVGAAGIVVGPLAGLTQRRMELLKQRWSYAELVDRFRQGPPRLSAFALPGVDAAANGIEFFIHHEDVRRAGDPTPPARDLGPEVEDQVWRRLQRMGRMLFRKAPVGVVLERDTGESVRAAAGSSVVTLIGRPSELLLSGVGRRAELRTVGEPESIERLRNTKLGF